MVRRGILVLGVALIGACSGETSGDGAQSSGGSGQGASSGAAGSAAAGGSGGSGASGGSGGSGGTGAAGGVGGSAGLDAGTGGSAGSMVACVDGAAMFPSVEERIRASCAVAVVRVTQIDGECSGAGGEHVTFEVLVIGRGAGLTSVAYGGHAYYAPSEGPDNVGEYFVAGIDPLGGLTPRPDDPGWCISGLPAIDGNVTALLEAADQPAAEALMTTILAP